MFYDYLKYFVSNFRSIMSGVFIHYLYMYTTFQTFLYMCIYIFTYITEVEIR